MNEHTKEPFWAKCGDMTPRDRRNLMWVMAVLGIWAVSFAGVSRLLKNEVLAGGPLPWLVALLPTIAGVLVVLTYARFLRQLDELQHVIQLQALALAFGGSFFAYCGYQVFERLGAPAGDISAFAVVWSVLYSFRSFLGWRRYR